MGYPLKVCELLQSIGGVAYLARTTVHTPANVVKTKQAIKKAFDVQLNKQGFSLVEVLTSCPVNWGMSPVEALDFVDQNMVPQYPLGEYKVGGLCVTPAV